MRTARAARLLAVPSNGMGHLDRALRRMSIICRYRQALKAAGSRVGCRKRQRASPCCLVIPILILPCRLASTLPTLSACGF